jgi:hypothetical protein
MIFIDTSHMYLTFFGDSYILKGEGFVHFKRGISEKQSRF